MTTSQDSVIGNVLEQNAEVVDQIKSASSELEVVHAVLSTQLPSGAEKSGDLPAAAERTEELAQQLAKTAEALERSNEQLRELDANNG